MSYSPAQKPTLYFIGVTTGNSSIMRVFPAWCDALGLGDVAIEGMDFAPHAEPRLYREAVAFIKGDALAKGALVTTHKLDLFAACADMFDSLDDHAQLMAEVSCLSKRGGRLIGHAKDPISSGLAIDGFLPPSHFAKTDAAVFAMGAGGSTIALTWHLLQKSRGRNRPARFVVSNRSPSRLDHIRRIHEAIGADLPIDYVLAPAPEDNDRVLASLPSGSLVINATGLGKDAPGSPLSGRADFPDRGIVWELNYRGDLMFLDQARGQRAGKSLQIEDGWTYFIHGWTRVIAEVFDIAIPTEGAEFGRLSEIARAARGRT